MILFACATVSQERLLSYLSSKPGVRIIGPADASNGKRVPTIGFIHETKLPKDIVAGLHEVCHVSAYAKTRCGIV